MNSATKRIVPLVQRCSKQVTQTIVRNSSENVTEVPSKYFNKMKAYQKVMQIDDGVPVYIKGGRGDKILYQVTVLLTFIGLGMGCHALGTITFK